MIHLLRQNCQRKKKQKSDTNTPKKIMWMFYCNGQQDIQSCHISSKRYIFGAVINDTDLAQANVEQQLHNKLPDI